MSQGSMCEKGRKINYRQVNRRNNETSTGSYDEEKYVKNRIFLYK